jgi:RNA polymerase sigma factor (sigma-70 family)
MLARTPVRPTHGVQRQVITRMLGTGFPAVLAEARTGAAAAWSALLDDLSGPLLGFARGRGVEDPEDVLGETFLHVARGLDGFAGDEAGFRAWVFTIAHRRVVDAQRRRHRQPSIPLPAEQLMPLVEALDAGKDEVATAIERLDGDARLGALLAHLTDEQREVLVLRYVADLDATAVGVLTGRSTNAVAAITRRALLRLEEVFERAAATTAPISGSASPDADRGR